MSYSAEESALRVRFASAWTQTPVHWPNVAFESAGKEEWVRFRVFNEPAKQAAMGGGNQHLYRYPGFVFILIFVKPNMGTGRMTDLVEAVENVWRGAEFSNIKMGVPSVETIGVVDGMYQVNVRCPYYRDEIKSRSA